MYMEKTLLFLFVAFGDFRNQVEPFSSLDKNRLFFSCSFPPFDISKSFKYHKTDLAVNGEVYHTK